MSEIVKAIRGHPKWVMLIGTGIGITVIALQALWRRFVMEGRGKKLPRLKTSVWKFSEHCEINISTFNLAIDGLENLLVDLEPQRFNSDLSRGKYELISSIVARLRGICSDLQRYMSEDFRKKVSTEEIARSVWIDRSISNIRAGTLSVFSDDSFNTACDDFGLDDNADAVVPLNIDVSELEFYRDGVKAVREGRVKYRKSRAEFCKCGSEQEFASKLYCLRKAFRVFMDDEHKVHWFIQSGRVLLADLLRHSGRDVASFYDAYDRMMQFLLKEENRIIILEELAPRKVEELNLWDVLFDFVMLDAFDDLQKPPSSITALVKNSWLGYAMKESAINNIVWSLIKIKRSRLKNPDGFISRFYDISSIITTPLTFGLLGGRTEEFEEICLNFKENIVGFVFDIFNFEKVRYTFLNELYEDVEKLLTERVELLKVKTSNELFPPA